MSKTDLEIFIEEEAAKVKGTAVPIKASIIERLIVRKLACKRLHPNPEDEFSFSNIGPNMQIIGSYVTQFKNNIEKSLPLMDDPIIVQKIRPSGYMLLNGHHRWAAAMRLGIRRVPVEIVNAVFDGDIRKMLEVCVHEKRATLDLDEVVFASEGDTVLERRHGLLSLGLQKKRLRLGIPALFKNLKVKGYDIWVYSSQFYSTDDLKRYFKHYGVTVDGIVTGMKKTTGRDKERTKKTEDLFANKYKSTLHIDREMLLITHGRSNDFDEVEIKCEEDAWSKAVIDALDGIDVNVE
ncbi:MAG: ParB/Srx family N-terminal domain-containing protein [Lachnospiraceae bacterium]|nr:ParB/Srx family N-terminal domain-containing protein [Lachnospiraceae bacterium]